MFCFTFFFKKTFFSYYPSFLYLCFVLYRHYVVVVFFSPETILSLLCGIHCLHKTLDFCHQKAYDFFLTNGILILEHLHPKSVDHRNCRQTILMRPYLNHLLLCPHHSWFMETVRCTRRRNKVRVRGGGGVQRSTAWVARVRAAC